MSSSKENLLLSTAGGLVVGKGAYHCAYHWHFWHFSSALKWLLFLFLKAHLAVLRDRIWALDPRSTQSIKGRLQGFIPFIFQRNASVFWACKKLKLTFLLLLFTSVLLNPQPDPAYSGGSPCAIKGPGRRSNLHFPPLFVKLYIATVPGSLPVCTAPPVPHVRLGRRLTSGKVWRTSWTARNWAAVGQQPVTSEKPTLLLKATVNKSTSSPGWGVLPCGQIQMVQTWLSTLLAPFSLPGKGGKPPGVQCLPEM